MIQNESLPVSEDESRQGDADVTCDHVESLKPKPPPKLAPRGIRSFSVHRAYDETGVSGEGVVIEGVSLATGQCVIHWLYPPPRGGIAIFDTMDDFIKVHIGPHPANRTTITYQNGEQQVFPPNETSQIDAGEQDNEQ